MIWYETLPIVGIMMFVVLLLTTASQTIIALEAGVCLRDKRSLLLIRMLYGVLAVLSAVLALEAIMAIASIEGGIYLSIPTFPRYVSILPLLLYFYTISHPVELPAQLRPSALNFFIPLLCLPPIDWLPTPLPVVFAVFATMWFLLDAARMLLLYPDL